MREYGCSGILNSETVDGKNRFFLIFKPANVWKLHFDNTKIDLELPQEIIKSAYQMEKIFWLMDQKHLVIVSGKGRVPDERYCTPPCYIKVDKITVIIPSIFYTVMRDYFINPQESIIAKPGSFL